MKLPKEAYIAYPANTVRILKATGFEFRQSLGQNFLVDLAALEGIACMADLGPEDTVIEIGPGIGGLTQFLAEDCGRVIAVEIDQRLIPILRDNLSAYQNVEIVEADFLELELADFLKEHEITGPVHIVSNLPYYITTPILRRVLDNAELFASMTVMVQEEATARITAKLGTKEYGPLAIAVDMFTEVSPIQLVSREGFIPAPNVDSAVVRMDILPKPRVDIADKTAFIKLVEGAFFLRRKTLPNSFAAYGALGLSKAGAMALLETAGIAANVRGETLTLADYEKLCRAYREMKQ